VERLDLIPSTHRAERLFLLDVLGDSMGEMQFGRELDADAFLSITPEKLYPFLHVRLNPHAERLRMPAKLGETLAAHHRKNLLLELRRVADLRRLDATLTAANLPYLILKGPVLAASVYPDRASRTMTDLDLLIADEEMTRAMEVLATIGYRVPAQFAGSEVEAGDAPPLVHDQPGGLVLELHSMLDSLPEERAALAAVLPSARRVPVGHGLELPAPERGEFFAHVVAHVSKHHRFEGELRSLLDVALLLKADVDAFDWEALDAEWQRRGISEWIALTVTLAHRLLGSPLPEIYRARMISAEALAIAAEQLWVVERNRLPPRVMYAAAGQFPTPVHAQVPRSKAAVPSGLRGIGARAARQWQRMRRVWTAFRRGTMRPSVVAADVDLFLKRERLFALIESREHPSR
jgi:hypothetical protein